MENLSAIAKKLGSRGGKATARKGKKFLSERSRKRFIGKTKEEISEMMRQVQRGKW